MLKTLSIKIIVNPRNLFGEYFMQNSMSTDYKKYKILLYITLLCFFCSNSILFQQGLFAGFIAGILWYVPTYWIIISCLPAICLQAFSGELVSYIYIFSLYIAVSALIKYFPIKNIAVSLATCAIFYFPSLYLFQLTTLFHFLNFCVCVIAGIISEQIIKKLFSSSDLGVFFSSTYHNCFVLFIVGLGSIALTFWKIDMYLLLFSMLALIYSEVTDEKTALWGMTFFAFAGYIAGCGYAMVFLAVSGIIIFSFLEFGKIATACIYFLAVGTTSLFVTDINFDFYTCLISCSLGIVLYLIIPCKKIKKTSTRGKYASQNDIVNRDRSKMSVKIDQLARCFHDISESYKKISKQNTKSGEIMKYITKETVQSVCEGCDKSGFCNKNNLQRLAEIDYLAHCAQTKGKTTILDVGDYISAHCIRKLDILTEVNKKSGEVLDQNIKNEEKAKSKEEIACVYSRVAKVLHKLSVDASRKLSFDSSAELQISQALDRADVFYKELFLYQNDSKCICVELIGCGSDACIIQNCIEKVFGCNFVLSSMTKDTATDCDYIIFSKSPSIKIEYGVKTKPKRANQPNGDCLTVLDQQNGKFICVICDGMGSGENAHEFSCKAVTFIENLFKASFPTSDIVASVNSFMESCEYNSYATLDILELDLYKHQAYLYKVGSPDTYYQSKKTHVISSKALPIGIMKDLKLEINSFQIFPRDRIVISSDGILDFMREEIKTGLQSKNWLSPQIFADEIMASCDKKMKGGLSDDRTIITIEIMENA